MEHQNSLEQSETQQAWDTHIFIVSRDKLRNIEKLYGIIIGKMDELK